jgi:glycosyltransferase involved in cell wall biosynthesis
LADEKNLAIPDDLTDVVLPLGTPSDQGLLAIMQAVDLGLSMSFWEGFNLPLVEMQHVGRPVLAFTTGANPEVIADPWFMCRDQAQMVEKGNCLLGWGELPPSRSLRALLEYKKRFPWSDTLEAWWQEVKKLACSIPATPRNEIGRRTVFIDVTNSARDEANSGVIRVTRQLTRRLQTHAGLDVICVGWNREGYFAELVDPRHSHLGDFGGPLDPHGRMVDPAESRAGLERLVYAADPRMPIAPVLFFPEVALDGTLSHRIKWAHDRGIMTSAILHDLVPHYYPQYCSQEVISGFKPYIKAMTSVDQILANSTATLTDFNRYSQETRAPMPPSTQAIWLPAQFANVNRVTHFEMPSSSVIRILCVSTIEPRKNHMRLIDAYRELVRRRPDLRFRLVLVGNRYAGAEELANRILSAAGEGIGIEWQNVLTDEALLVQLAAARFTVYPSVVEGFGMPIAESLWLGKPVVCANSGAMYELARAGGCLTVDVTDIEALSAALERLSTDNEMHRRLSTEALSRTLLDWNEYATCIGDELFGLMNPYPPSPMRNHVIDTEGAVMPGLELAHPLGRFLSLISRTSTSGASSGPSDPIRKLYAELLGREVDAIGLNYWRDVAARSGDFEAVRAGIMASEEYRKKKNSSARSEVAG